MLARRVSVNNGMRRHLLGDDCAGTDKSVLTDGIPTDNCGIRANASASFYQGEQIVFALVSGECGSWRANVRKDDRGATENVVFESDALIHRNIVLNLDVVADLHSWTNDHILANSASLANARAREEVTEMPDGRITAYLDFIIDVG